EEKDKGGGQPEPLSESSTGPAVRISQGRWTAAENERTGCPTRLIERSQCNARPEQCREMLRGSNSAGRTPFHHPGDLARRAVTTRAARLQHGRTSHASGNLPLPASSR